MKQRELKFRAWDIQQKRMISNTVVGGDIVIAEYELLTEDTDFEPTYYSCENSKSKYPFVVMQYTGLKDKNRKEIYEGDILKTGTKEILSVFFNSSTGSFDVEFPGGDCEKLVGEDGWQEDLRQYKYKIIGNVYENEELIKSKAQEE